MPGECETSVGKLGVLERVRVFPFRAKTAHMNEDAFGVFYDRTARPLWAYLLRVSGDRDTADDLLQESYCRMLAAKLPAMNEAECKSYLFRTATNLLRDRWRHKKIVERHAAPEEGYSEQRESPEMQRAFAQLKPAERELLWLAYVEGCSHEEIGGVTGRRAGSIRVLLFRARKKLAAALAVGRAGASAGGKE